MSRIRSSRGQTSVEYMLVIAVIAVAVVAAMHVFPETFNDAMESFSDNSHEAFNKGSTMNQ